MKILFLNADGLFDAIDIVSKDLCIEAVSVDADFEIRVKKSNENILRIEIDAKGALIEYGGGISVFLRGLATAIGMLREGKRRASISYTPIFTLNGAMIDMSRNAVMTVNTVKFMMRKMALMGMNAFMLYTEDTYELEGYSYFGHMRGRYTKEELRELDAYALSLGIELIPCIQMLGHLGHHQQSYQFTLFVNAQCSIEVALYLLFQSLGIHIVYLLYSYIGL